MQPIIRWAGSKAKVLDVLLSNSPKQFGRYIEPFAGSASLFFGLEPKSAILGDINGELINTYAAVKSSPQRVADLLDSIPKSVDSYYQIRALKPENLCPEERAARLIFLMKSCFNGVYRTNRSGSFNVPFGSRIYAMPTAQHLKEVSQLLKDTELLHGGFESTLERAQEGDWVYVDPPYRYTTRYRGEYGYDASFADTDLNELVKLCQSLSSKGIYVTFSYKQDASLMKMFCDWNIATKSVSRTVSAYADRRNSVSELLISNF